MEESREKKGNDSSLYERFLQTLSITIYMLFLVTGFMSGWLVMILSIYYSPLLRIPMLLYAAWIFYDRDTAEKDSRRWEAMREWSVWKYQRDYFPAKVIKTAELSPDRNYLFASFPHGILASGANCAFGNNVGGFKELFPGLRSSLVVLPQHFHTPFIREYALSIGALPSSATCLTRVLGGEEKGKAVALMVGGAQETFYTKPGTYTFMVKRRKGFVKIALKTGASLVPVITFGEPDIYDQIRFKEDSFAFKVQILFKKVTNIAPVLFYGRFSVTPFRRPLYTVVGGPIHVEKVAEPTNEQVDELHAKFLQKLTELFEREKHKYVENASNVHLTLL